MDHSGRMAILAALVGMVIAAAVGLNGHVVALIGVFIFAVTFRG
jgi:hypothetical protein